MEAIRETIHLRTSRLTIELPGSYSGKDVEVIILPFNPQTSKAMSKKKRFSGLFAKPLRVDHMEPFDRDALHDRKNARALCGMTPACPWKGCPQ